MHRLLLTIALLAPLSARAQADWDPPVLTWDPPVVDAGHPEELPAVDAGSMPTVTTAQPRPLAHANVGHAEGWFFLRSDDDNFVLIPSGRLQTDFYAYQGGTNAPSNTFLVPQARLEAMGTILKHWDFDVGGQFSASAQPTDVDAYLNANFTTYANVQAGQFDAPFTMENRTNDKWTDLQGRSTVASAFAVPENKALGAMVWGQPEGRWAYWSGGVFNGGGLDNISTGSTNFDVMGRAWFAPFGLADIDLLRHLWIGASGWAGNRQSTPAQQVDRLAMVDQGGVTFWSPVYGSIHAGDQGSIDKWGLEFNVPVGSVVLKGEWVSSTEQMRELDEAMPNARIPVRNSVLQGTGYYGRASFFVWGDALINGLAGAQDPPHLFGVLAPDSLGDALQLVANADHLSFTYRAGATLPPTDPLVGNDDESIFGAGINYWYSRHIRLTANFLYDNLTGPGPRPEASSINSYELTLRAALAL